MSALQQTPGVFQKHTAKAALNSETTMMITLDGAAAKRVGKIPKILPCSINSVPQALLKANRPCSKCFPHRTHAVLTTALAHGRYSPHLTEEQKRSKVKQLGLGHINCKLRISFLGVCSRACTLATPPHEGCRLSIPHNPTGKTS